MAFLLRLPAIMLTMLLVTSCSGLNPQISDSWSNQNYKGKIKKVYIIGIAEKDHNRMIFEDTFESRLTREGVKVVASYKDLIYLKNATREDIIQKMRENNCDSVLLTRVIGQAKKTFYTGGGKYKYYEGPSYDGSGVYSRPHYYDNWANYYEYSEGAYLPEKRLEFNTIIAESVLFDLQTEELIWSAQLETIETQVERNIEKIMQLFIDEVTRDLKIKELI